MMTVTKRNAEPRKALTKARLMTMMERLADAGDADSYRDLWKAVRVLNALGLCPDEFAEAAVKKDHDLFMEDRYPI